MSEPKTPATCPTCGKHSMNWDGGKWACPVCDNMARLLDTALRTNEMATIRRAFKLLTGRDWKK